MTTDHACGKHRKPKPARSTAHRTRGGRTKAARSPASARRVVCRKTDEGAGAGPAAVRCACEQNMNGAYKLGTKAAGAGRDEGG